MDPCGDRCEYVCEFLGRPGACRIPAPPPPVVNLERWKDKLFWREEIKRENPHWADSPRKLVWMLQTMKLGRAATPGCAAWANSYREWLLSLPLSKIEAIIGECDTSELRRMGLTRLFSYLRASVTQQDLFRSA